MIGAEIAPPDLRCRISVAIPAHDEEAAIEATLGALIAQCTAGGERVDSRSFEVLVYANNCTDSTAARVRAFADRYPAYRLHVVSGWIAPPHAHVGTARRAVMDLAAERMYPRGGAIATTDADTIAHARWLAATSAALQSVHAVAGRIIPKRDELARENDAVRERLAIENAYRFRVAELDALLDPRAHDPWPRHGQQFAGSLAMRASIYRAVGGLPALARMEDIAMYGALLRHDALVRHSMHVRVATSMRVRARVRGGYGSHLEDYRALGEAGNLPQVEPAETTILRLAARGRARTWYGRGRGSGERTEVAALFGISEWALCDRAMASPTCGALLADLERDAEDRGVFITTESASIAAASAAIAAAIARARNVRGLPSAAVDTRAPVDFFEGSLMR